MSISIIIVNVEHVNVPRKVRNDRDGWILALISENLFFLALV
jgi:hypothetical protein